MIHMQNKEHQVRVSVIVPVYNAEETIVACAGNLVSQTLDDIEILFVDDCSTDQSFAILQQIMAQFPDKVKVYQTEENSGPGGARNIGMKYASGMYIGFVDSDDLADVTMYEKLFLRAQETHADIVDCAFINEETQAIVMPADDCLTGQLDNHRRNTLIAAEGYVWSKLFRTSLLKEHRVLFREGTAMEDTDFVLYVYAIADSLQTVKEPLYKHVCNREFIMQKMDGYSSYVTSKNAMLAIYDRMSGLSGYEKIQAGCEAMLIGLYLSAIVYCLELKEENEREVIACLQDLAEIRHKVILNGYKNEYLLQGIDENCMRIMELNDRNSEELYQIYRN